VWGAVIVDFERKTIAHSGSILGMVRESDLAVSATLDTKVVDALTLDIQSKGVKWRLQFKDANDCSKIVRDVEWLRKSVEASQSSSTSVTSSTLGSSMTAPLSELTLSSSSVAPPVSTTTTTNPLFVAYVESETSPDDDIALKPGERVLVTDRKGSYLFVEPLDRKEGLVENGWVHQDRFGVHDTVFGDFGMEGLLQNAQEHTLMPGETLTLNGDLFVVTNGWLETRVGDYKATLYTDSICGELIFLIGAHPWDCVTAPNGASVARIKSDVLLQLEPASAVHFFSFLCVTLRKKLAAAQRVIQGK
jgi:hypothetical protein